MKKDTINIELVKKPIESELQSYCDINGVILYYKIESFNQNLLFAIDESLLQ